jgi:ElaB/YqjD/DUF883 family membrane-anchored ribosome-binding protein
MRSARLDPNAVDVEFLRKEFNKFRAELAGMKDKIGTNAAEALDEIAGYLNGQSVTSKLSALESEIENLTAKLRDSGKVAVTKLETQVNSRPITSLAAAFGLGLIAAQFLRRR